MGNEWLLRELHKAVLGEPSAVTLAPIDPENEDLKAARMIREKGYQFAFGEGMTRRELAESLPDRKYHKN